jgi:tetratricopeptide (TPR) repeat protein
VPFSADSSRTESSALGVIGSPSSDFPDTLKQFRAHAGPTTPRLDSLSPLQTETESASAEPAPWRASRFWASLAVGFGVGAVIAAVLSQREATPPPVSAPRAALPPAPVAPPSVALPGCVVASAGPPVTSAAPSTANKPTVTPALERRFWLERARSAQRDYRLQDAERFYRRVLALSPRDSEALSGVGELELLRGAPQEAGARFREALASNADYLPALVALADLHWQAGEADAARDGYRNIVEHYADDLYPPYVKQRLEADTCVPQCR